MRQITNARDRETVDREAKYVGIIKCCSNQCVSGFLSEKGLWVLVTALFVDSPGKSTEVIYAFPPGILPLRR